MITVRPADDRGHTKIDWLDSRHSFSFADYFDPRHQQFRALRVINDDLIGGGHGFGMHPHRDMEIVSYIVEGALAHKDSMGNGSTLRRGDVQTMTAGTGILHSEHNPVPGETMRLLQIWLMPAARNLTPGWAEKHFDDAEKRGRLKLLVSGDGRDGSLKINQDAAMFASLLDAGQSVQHRLESGRHAWVQMVTGTITLGDVELVAGDGAAISDESEFTITARESAEFLLFDLA